jgi:hypothetical protein
MKYQRSPGHRDVTKNMNAENWCSYELSSIEGLILRWVIILFFHHVNIPTSISFPCSAVADHTTIFFHNMAEAGCSIPEQGTRLSERGEAVKSAGVSD